MVDATSSLLLSQILTATSPSDLFTGDPTNPGDARRARRSYRTLIAHIHPDLLTAGGVDPHQSQQATARLNQLYAQWQQPTRPAGGQPYVSGQHDTYRLGRRIRQLPLISTFATPDPQIFVDISRTAHPATEDLVQASHRLGATGMAAFVPELLDHGTTSRRAWAAYRLPAGLRSLRAVHAAFPGGLDGRDWAWMARRILMVLDAAESPHGGLGLDTVAIHPEQHGVLVTGWGGYAATGGHRDDLAGLRALFRDLLRPSESRQLAFIAGTGDLSAARLLHEYDLLLRVCYGPRRFRPLAMPTGIA